jgi:hypothetical protein
LKLAPTLLRFTLVVICIGLQKTDMGGRVNVEKKFAEGDKLYLQCGVSDTRTKKPYHALFLS